MTLVLFRWTISSQATVHYASQCSRTQKSIHIGMPPRKRSRTNAQVCAKAPAQTQAPAGTSGTSGLVPPVLGSSVAQAPTPQQQRAAREFGAGLLTTQRGVTSNGSQPASRKALDEVIELRLRSLPKSSCLVTVGIDTKTPPPPKGSPRSPYVFRTSEQVARLLNLKCEMKSWIACPHPDLATAAIVLTFGPSQLKSLQELLASDSMRVGFGLRLAVTQRHEIRTLRQIYSSLLHFGICCGMLLSGNWIHVGGKANRLAMAEVLSPDKSTAGSCTVGASMLTVTQCVPEQGLLRMQVSPATFRVVKPDLSSSDPVELLHPRCVLLPHMTEATIVGWGPAPNPPPGLKSKEDLVRYWRYLHGYELPEDAVKRTVQVQFPRGSLVLTYPLGCVWATPWTYLPAKTGQFDLIESHEPQPEAHPTMALPQKASEVPRKECQSVEDGEARSPSVVDLKEEDGDSSRIVSCSGIAGVSDFPDTSHGGYSLALTCVSLHVHGKFTITSLGVLLVMASVSATVPSVDRGSSLPESHRTLLWPTLLETVNLSATLGPAFSEAIAKASERTYEKFLEQRRIRLEKKGKIENGTMNSGIVNDDFYHWQMALPITERPLEETAEFHQLLGLIDRLARRYLEHSGGDPQAIARKKAMDISKDVCGFCRFSMSYWTAVHFANEYHSPHTHTGQDCVAVFYAKVARGANNGKLILMDPRGQVPPFGRTLAMAVPSCVAPGRTLQLQVPIDVYPRTTGYVPELVEPYGLTNHWFRQHEYAA
ncbi:hypothetical protein FOZ60_004438 [Perkinsus olseni]|uniref:DUF4708 domain-containing protein n=1 Tax=Perkinsus olseni TaxID=32597 RepID=A0A7J6PPA6_PEROL|nr:hypothetical protein FOZ60_004438 [Perkinsus olseni]